MAVKGEPNGESGYWISASLSLKELIGFKTVMTY